MTLTGKQVDLLWEKVKRAEEIALSGSRAQVWLDTNDGDVWCTTFSQGETYMETIRSQTYVKLWEVEPHTLKDLGLDEGFPDYPWDDKDFTQSYEYYELEDMVLEGEFPDYFDIDNIVDHILVDILSNSIKERERPSLDETDNL